MMVGGDRRVIAEHLRAGAEEPGRIFKLGEMHIEQRPHGFLVEKSAEFQPRCKLTHWHVSCMHRFFSGDVPIMA